MSSELISLDDLDFLADTNNEFKESAEVIDYKMVKVYLGGKD